MQTLHKDGIFVIDNFLNSEECDFYISEIKIAEKEKARKFAEVCDFYNHKQINTSLTDFFWNKLKQTLPKKYVDKKGDIWEIQKPSKYVASAHYKKGEQFNIHTDTGIFDDNDDTIRSKFTTLIYLNSDFEGGETAFFNDNLKNTTTVVKPKKGKMLLFDIDLWHSALPIDKGDKYWIGFELMYKKVTPLIHDTQIAPQLPVTMISRGTTATTETATTETATATTTTATTDDQTVTKRWGSEGAILGLQLTGVQGAYLSENFTGDQFETSYKRIAHSTKSPFTGLCGGTVDFGKKCTFTIPRNCDMMKDIYLYVKVPKLDQYHRWVRYLGEALIKQIEFEIGGQRIDRHSSEYFHVYHKLYLTDEEKKVYYKQIGHVPENYNKVKDISEHNFVEWKECDEYELMIPLRFSFNRYKENTLPLISMNNHEVKINIEFEAKEKLIQCKSNCPSIVTFKNDSTKCSYVDGCVFTDGHLIIEGIHLCDQERKKHRDVSTEHLFEGLQFTGEEKLVTLFNKIRLNYNHPVKELIFFFSKYDKGNLQHKDIQSKSTIQDSKDAINILEMCDYLQNLQFKINGKNWFENEMSPKYFTTVQQSQHHTNQDDNIYCYSFSEHPEEYKPSGYLNFSQIDNGQLLMSLKSNAIDPEKGQFVNLTIFATYYGVLKFMGGMAGLAFSK